MSKYKAVSLLIVGLFLFFMACETQGPVTSTQQTSSIPTIEPESEIMFIGDAPGAVKVMTRNVYVGADVDVVLSAQNPEEIPILVAQAFQTLVATNFPERAVALVKEIATTQPHLIGLQEVALIRMQSPGDAVIGGTIPAEDVLMNYLDILMAVIEGAGLDYRVAGVIENADAEFPMIVNTNPLAFDDVRVTDYDVILARGDVEISDVFATNYAVNLVIPDVGLEILRGYVAATAKVGKKTYRFVNTHLEPFSIDVQLAQNAELLKAMEVEEWPVIMVGDFNTQAPTGLTYNEVLNAGYLDIWTENNLQDNPDGFTFGHAPDLLNEEANFWERIDFIFVKNNNPYVEEQVIDPVIVTVVGDDLEDRTTSGLWPSDHGGVVAGFRIPTSDRLVEEEIEGEPKRYSTH